MMVLRRSRGCGLQSFSATRILTDKKLTAETSWVNTTVAPNQESTKDWFGQDIQNAVEDSLRVRCDDISALGESPSDWVEEPEESSPSTDSDVSF